MGGAGLVGGAEGLVGDAQIGNEAIFERLNGAFSRISAVAIQRKELVVKSTLVVNWWKASDTSLSRFGSYGLRPH
jgi:hypothetical protein